MLVEILKRVFLGWQAREHLVGLSPDNLKTLETIESATVLVCLDDSEPFSVPESQEAGEKEKRLLELSWRLWVGEGGRNRWFDKHECECLARAFPLSDTVHQLT